MKLYSKISLVNLLIFGSILFFSISIFYFSSRHILIDEQEKDLAELAYYYLKPTPGRNPMGTQGRMTKQGLADMLYIASINGNGDLKVIQDPYGIGTMAQKDIFSLDEYDFLGLEVTFESEKYIFVREITSVTKSLRTIGNRFIIISVVLLGIAVFFSAISAKYSLKPLMNLIKGIRSINTSKLKTQFDISKNDDEIDELKKSLNSMFFKLNEGFELQKRFNSDVSHELRTPITSIKGYANLLRKWGIDDKIIASESIDAIISTSNDMEKLVEQLLILGKLEEMDINKSLIKTDELIENTEKKLSRKYPERSFNFKINDIKKDFQGHFEYLMMMIEIFVDNAVKYSNPEEEIDITFEKNSIKIKDRGIGIPVEEIDRVFNRFYKVDSSRSKKTNDSSHGIGLSIAQTIADKLNMRIKVKSEIKKGTEITLYFNDSHP